MYQSGFVLLSPSCIFDVRGHRIRFEDCSLRYLTEKEFSVLCFLVSREGETQKKDDIIDAVWGEGYEGDASHASLSNQIKQLKAIDDSLKNSIHNVHGVGYLFERKNAAVLKKLLADRTATLAERVRAFGVEVDDDIAEQLDLYEKKISFLFEKIKDVHDYNLPENVRVHFQMELDEAINDHTILKARIFRNWRDIQYKFSSEHCSKARRSPRKNRRNFFLNNRKSGLPKLLAPALTLSETALSICRKEFFPDEDDCTKETLSKS